MCFQEIVEMVSGTEQMQINTNALMEMISTSASNWICILVINNAIVSANNIDPSSIYITLMNIP